MSHENGEKCVGEVAKGALGNALREALGEEVYVQDFIGVVTYLDSDGAECLTVLEPCGSKTLNVAGLMAYLNTVVDDRLASSWLGGHEG